jgi:hypothetical protein
MSTASPIGLPAVAEDDLDRLFDLDLEVSVEKVGPESALTTDPSFCVYSCPHPTTCC